MKALLVAILLMAASSYGQEKGEDFEILYVVIHCSIPDKGSLSLDIKNPECHTVAFSENEQTAREQGVKDESDKMIPIKVDIGEVKVNPDLFKKALDFRERYPEIR